MSAIANVGNVELEKAAREEAEHHKQPFINKYIFSTDHKMIAKQYLITGLIMGAIGIFMSILIRLQLAWPEESFWIFEVLIRKVPE